MKAKKTTPLMQQYREAKERHPDLILLFRMGDYYEAFNEDARVVARVLGLTPTRLPGILHAGARVVSVVFSQDCLEAHLHTLLQAGHRVAICEEVDEATKGKPVERVVTGESWDSLSQAEKVQAVEDLR